MGSGRCASCMAGECGSEGGVQRAMDVFYGRERWWTSGGRREGEEKYMRRAG